MPEANLTVDERLTKVETNVALLAQTVNRLADSVDASIKRQQFSWSAVSSMTPMVAALGALALFIVGGYFNGLIVPIRDTQARHEAEHERFFANSERNSLRIGMVESDVRGLQENVTEIEQQFKAMGQATNSNRLEDLRAHCRMSQTECTSLQYWPELGRLVSQPTSRRD